MSMLSDILSEFKASIPKVAKATGLAAGRVGVGAGQGLSGLYDLASPGTGTSRATKMLNNTAQSIDRSANEDDINPAYKIMQAALTPASFFAPGGLVKALGAAPELAGVSTATAGLNKTIPAATNAAKTLATGGAVSRVAGQAMQGAKPINVLNAGYGTGTDLGRQSGAGQQVSPLDALLTGGLNAATPFALPAAGQGVIEAGRAVPGVVRQAGNAAGGVRSNMINNRATANGIKTQISQLDRESQAHQRQLAGLPINNYKAAEVLQRKIDRNEAIKKSLLTGSAAY